MYHEEQVGNAEGLGEFHRTEIRGHTRILVRAPFFLRALAILVDFQILALIAAVVLRVGSIPPYWDGRWVWPVLAVYFLIQWAQIRLLGGTFGLRVWWMKRLLPKTHQPAESFLAILRTRVFQMETLSGSNFGQALIATTVALAIGAGSTALTLKNHPAWSEAEPLRIEPSFPGASEQNQWIVAPFFYAIAAWPRVFSGQPVLYSVPYEKGPPHQFLGHIIGRWELPETKLILEGPWSPPLRPKPDLLQKCLSSTWWWHAKTCLPVRTESLRKHVEEMAEIHPDRWKLNWFEVDNPTTPPEQRARGLRIEAHSDTRAEIRYVLVNPNGVQQAIALHYVPGHHDELAINQFEKIIQSLRIGDEIFSGRAWADHELERVKLDEMRKAGINSAEFLTRFAEIQTLLLSKLSVDPKSYDAFFHLGGTAVLLAQFARKNKDAELSAAAKPLVRNAFRYAQDLAPNDPRTAQLEALWLQIKSD